MAKAFLLPKENFSGALKLPNKSAVAGTDFDVSTNINGQTITFHFAWNAVYHFYTVDIKDADDNRLKFWHPTTDEPLIIQNFDKVDKDRPDIMIVLADLTLNEKPPHPTTIGRSHILVFLYGKWSDV